MKQPGDQEAQRDIFNIDNKGTVTVVNHPTPQRSRSESLLLQAVKQEVISRLDQSLHNAVFINLSKQSQPQQVRRRLDAEVKIGSKSPEALSAETTILEVFDRPGIDGRLLILGEPGAGKTTTMLDLAKGLCDRAEQDATAFIPVLLNLSSWKDPKQAMTVWLVEELKSKYGVRKDIGTKWLADKQLLPLLDGLDEVKPEHQEGCVQAINRWLESEDRPPSLAICCRREEYEKVVRGQWQAEADEVQDETRMHLNGAILLQTLTDEQIQTYLTAANQPELWQTLEKDSKLLELVRTPLFLSILGFIAAHHQLSIQYWRSLHSTETRLQYLFDAYWQAAIERELVSLQMRSKITKSQSYGKNIPPNQKQTRQWLVFLAQQLGRESHNEFLIESIQPSWLEFEAERKGYLIKVWHFFSIAIGFSIGVSAGLNSGRIFDTLFVTILIVVPIELLGWLTLFAFPKIGGNVLIDLETKEGIKGILNTIEIHELLLFDLNEFKKGFVQSILVLPPIMFLNIALVGGIYLGLMPLFPTSTYYSLEKSIFLMISFVLCFCLIFGLGSGLFFGLRRSSLVIKKNPNQGTLKSAQNALSIGAISGLCCGLILALPSAFRELSYGALGLPIGVAVGLRFGGMACIKHLALRLILWKRNHIPWNYARFLDYCTERLLLQRVGGRYRFMHKSLQEHFARMGE